MIGTCWNLGKLKRGRAQRRCSYHKYARGGGDPARSRGGEVAERESLHVLGHGR